MKGLIKGVTLTAVIVGLMLGVLLLSNYIHYGTFIF